MSKVPRSMNNLFLFFDVFSIYITTDDVHPMRRPLLTRCLAPCTKKSVENKTMRLFTVLFGFYLFNTIIDMHEGWNSQFSMKEGSDSSEYDPTRPEFRLSDG